MPQFSSSRALATAVVVAIVIAGPIVGVVAFSGTSSAQQASAYAVAQGTTCTAVSPVTNANQTVTEFYDYRNPDDYDNGNENASTYSSYGTAEYQERSESVLFFYEGSEGASAVFLHDQLDGGSIGSTLTMDFSGLSGGEWVVEDDDYPDRDDEWLLDEDSATVHWKWGGDGRTDGGAFRGLESLAGPMVVDPAFNEDAKYWGDWGRSGNDTNLVDAWTLKDANGSETELDRDRRTFLHSGNCVGAETTASLDSPGQAETGENVTIDASDTTAEEGVGGYEWDLDDDGEVDAVTTDPTVTHAFEMAGNYTVGVTAFDTYGNADAASMTIDVSAPPTPPEAALDAPETATVDETVTLNATNSTDEGSITEYHWDVDGDGTAERNTTEPAIDHQYGEVGNVTASVTVVDNSSATDTATADISVLSPNQPPNASLDAPASVDEGESVTLDAGNSTDDRSIVSYQWDYDDNGEIDGETDNATVESIYNEPGNVTSTVTVVDADGATDEASVEIEVTEVNDPPTAELDAPETVTVNESVTLDASNSSDDGEIEEYRWDVDGDGEEDANTSEPTTTHVYEEADEYNASVTVVDDANQTATSSATLTVTEQSLDAAFDVTTENPTADEPVSFDATAFTPGDDIVGYAWTFGDGENATGDTVDHTYDSAGSYEVTLEVETTLGDLAVASATVDVDAADSGGGDGDGGNGDGGNGDGSDGDGDDGDDGDGDGGSGGGGAGSGGGGGGGGSGAGSSGGGGSGQDDPDDSDEDPGEPDIGGANVSLSAHSMLVGETLVVDATVSNTGDGPGTKTVEFEVEGELLEERGVPLDANETRTVTFTHEFTTPGNKSVKVDHQDKQYVTVEPREPDVDVATVEVGDQPVTAGEQFELTALVENAGDAEGTERVELVLFDQVVDAENVSLAAGDAARVTFTREIQAPGTYDVTVGNASTSVEVVGGNDTTQPTTASADADASNSTVPGFDLLVAAFAVTVASLLLLRRRET